MSARDVVKQTEDKMKKTVEATKREFHALRTGRASPSIVEGIRVDYYGTEMIIKQLATITAPDPKTVLIQPWDATALEAIEKAILKSELGITPLNDGKAVRLNLPQLTDERKAELLKKIKKLAEDGKVSLRTARRVANEELEKLQKSKAATEDERFKTQDEVQKMVDKYTAEVTAALEAKEKEISHG